MALPQDPQNIQPADLADPNLTAEDLQRVETQRPDLLSYVRQHPNYQSVSESTGTTSNQSNTGTQTAGDRGASATSPHGQPAQSSATGYQQRQAGSPGYQQPHGGPQYAAPQQAPGMQVTTSDERTWGVLMHVLAIFFGFIPPLIVWLIYKDRSRTLDLQGRTALNWNISVILYSFVSGLLSFIVIGLVMLAVLGVMHIVVSIIAAVKASKGEVWKYPLAIPFFGMSK